MLIGVLLRKSTIGIWTAGLAAAFLATGLDCSAAEPEARMWLSSGDGSQRLIELPAISFNKEVPAGLRIHVDPSRQFQEIEGFGASFTDSSSWLIHRSMNVTQRSALLRELFDPDTGLGLGVTRLPLGASDFSLEHYSFDDMPPGQTDPGLTHFSIERARADVLPLVREAKKINPSLKVFISPWSAPAWMKTSGSLITGRLDPRYYDAFARYFDRTLAAFQAEGVVVNALTMQNEPHFEPGDYPGMRMEPKERAAFISGHLGPLLASKWPSVKLFDWDHNWDQPESPLAVLSDPKARPFVAGVAWHCYGGDVGAQSEVHRQFPEIETWMTECSGGGWAPKWGESLSWMMQHLVIGNLRHWGRGTILWNLALDENSGPHLGGCGNCRGVVTINSQTGAVTRNVEYYALGHASRFLRPGARRIESDTGKQGLHTVAFIDAAKERIVLIALNASPDTREFSVVTGSRSFSTSLTAGSVATLVWPLPTSRGTN